MQIHTFVSPVMIDACDTGCRYFQFNFFYPAAVEQSIGKQKQKSAASSGFARLRGFAEKVDPETHGQNRPAAEAFFNPFTVAPAHQSNIADDAEKKDRDNDPLLITQKIQFYLFFDAGYFLIFKYRIRNEEFFWWTPPSGGISLLDF